MCRRQGRAVVCLLVFVAGCAVGPNFKRPDAPAGAGYLPGGTPKATASADGQSQVFEEGRQLQADWWRLFGSEKLDGLIARAIASNPNVEAADAALQHSEDSLRAGYGIFFPQVSGSASAARQDYNPLRVGQPLPSSFFSLFTLSASVSYTLDIFGGARRGLEKLKAQVDVQRYTLLATYLMLSSNIANTVIAQAGYREQVLATRELLTLEREQEKITEVQAKTGTQPYSNVLSIQSQIASTEATIPPLEQRIDQADHLLAALMGRTPAEWKEPPITLAEITLPKDLPVSLPSELVRQRPDILEAEATLHASSANIGVATAAMLPTLSLSAGYGANNTGLVSLLGANSSFWNLGANLAGPLFDGGTLWFQRKAAIEGYRQSSAIYRETVLGAFEQVADCLRALEHDAVTEAAQARAVDSAKEALRLLQITYQTGATTYLQVLTADQQYQQARIGQIQAQAQRLQDTVALYVALGGGWWNAHP